jgi:hypothetical protein
MIVVQRMFPLATMIQVAMMIIVNRMFPLSPLIQFAMRMRVQHRAFPLTPTVQFTMRTNKLTTTTATLSMAIRIMSNSVAISMWATRK